MTDTGRSAHLRPMLGREDVDILGCEVAFQGHYRVDRYRLRHRRFAGGYTEPYSREVFERGHAAAVLPYDPVADSVVLIEQFRIGAMLAGREPWMLEIVAGLLEPGETTEAVARREAVEESGLEVSALWRIGMAVLSPGAVTESIDIFCGRVDSAYAPTTAGLAAEHEDLRVHVLPYGEVAGLLTERRVENATALIALQWLALNREHVRRCWLADRRSGEET